MLDAACDRGWSWLKRVVEVEKWYFVWSHMQANVRQGYSAFGERSCARIDWEENNEASDDPSALPSLSQALGTYAAALNVTPSKGAPESK